MALADGLAPLCSFGQGPLCMLGEAHWVRPNMYVGRGPLWETSYVYWVRPVGWDPLRTLDMARWLTPGMNVGQGPFGENRLTCLCMAHYVWHIDRSFGSSVLESRLYMDLLFVWWIIWRKCLCLQLWITCFSCCSWEELGMTVHTHRKDNGNLGGHNTILLW